MLFPSVIESPLSLSAVCPTPVVFTTQGIRGDYWYMNLPPTMLVPLERTEKKPNASLVDDDDRHASKHGANLG